MKQEWRNRELECWNPKCKKKFFARYKNQVNKADAGLPVYCCMHCSGTAPKAGKKMEAKAKKIVVRCPWETGALRRNAETVPFHA